MRRGIHIAIALVVAILLAKPFDCFAGGAWTKKAADCCKKGKCAPTADADECCKATVPGGNQFLGSKATDHSSALVADLLTVNQRGLDSVLPNGPLFDFHSPPAAPPSSRLNLPLLI